MGDTTDTARWWTRLDGLPPALEWWNQRSARSESRTSLFVLVLLASIQVQSMATDDRYRPFRLGVLFLCLAVAAAAASARVVRRRRQASGA